MDQCHSSRHPQRSVMVISSKTKKYPEKRLIPSSKFNQVLVKEGTVLMIPQSPTHTVLADNYSFRITMSMFNRRFIVNALGNIKIK